MNKYFAGFCMVGTILSASLAAQDNSLDLFKKIDKLEVDKTGEKPADPKAPAAPQQEPTIITATKESSFDGKTKIAIFVGDVHIKNPQFTLSADKLTVFFKKEGEEARPTPTPKPVATGSSSPIPGGGGFEKMIAEGNVVIESDRPGSNGGPPVHYIGKGEKVDYTAATGEAILRGWPSIQQGINTIVATESSTVIYLYRDGRMDIKGGQKTNINDTGPGGNPLEKK